MASKVMAQEKIWVDKALYDRAECLYHEKLSKINSIASATEISDYGIGNRVSQLEKENQDLKNTIEDLKNMLQKMEIRVKDLEGSKNTSNSQNLTSQPAKQNAVSNQKQDDDDDVDLFGSDSEGEDAEAAKVREARLAAYNAKKSKKPVLIAKSNIILDIKPWDDETDMKVMEEVVRKIEMDGLLWGAAKLVPLAYGIRKLQISCVVEDDKVSVDDLTEKIVENEDYVQSVDIAAFNKV